MDLIFKVSTNLINFTFTNCLLLVQKNSRMINSNESYSYMQNIINIPGYNSMRDSEDFDPSSKLINVVTKELYRPLYPYLGLCGFFKNVPEKNRKHKTLKN